MTLGPRLGPCSSCGRTEPTLKELAEKAKAVATTSRIEAMTQILEWIGYRINEHRKEAKAKNMGHWGSTGNRPDYHWSAAEEGREISMLIQNEIDELKKAQS